MNRNEKRKRKEMKCCVVLCCWVFVVVALCGPSLATAAPPPPAAASPLRAHPNSLSAHKEELFDASEVIELYVTKYKELTNRMRNQTSHPYVTKATNTSGFDFEWELGGSWRSGFFSGVLWRLANVTGELFWGQKREREREREERTQHTTHNTQHTTQHQHNINTQHTTHNTQHTTHNTQHAAHNTQHTTSTPTPGDQELFSEADYWTQLLKDVSLDTGTHDVGFVIFCSYGNGVIDGNKGKDYEDVIVQAAHSLAQRFNAKVGMTRSWGKIDDMSHFQVCGKQKREGRREEVETAPNKTKQNKTNMKQQPKHKTQDERRKTKDKRRKTKDERQQQEREVHKTTARQTGKQAHNTHRHTGV